MIGLKFLMTIVTAAFGLAVFAGVILLFIFVANKTFEWFCKLVGWNIRDFWQWSGIKDFLEFRKQKRKEKKEARESDPDK